MSGWFQPFLELIKSNCGEILAEAAKDTDHKSVLASATFGQPGVARVEMFWEKSVGDTRKLSTRCFYVTRKRDGELTLDQQRLRLRDAILATQQEMRDPADFDDDVLIEHDREHFVIEI